MGAAPICEAAPNGEEDDAVVDDEMPAAAIGIATAAGVAVGVAAGA